MFVVVLAGLTLSSVFPPYELASWFGLWFIAAQLTLSYVISGVAKAIGPRWRDGTGLRGVVSTYSYGSPFASRVLEGAPFLSLALSWLIIAWESSFALAWFLPKEGVFLFLALGVLFHLGNAVFMGLNNFVFAFIATYPVTWLCMTSKTI